MVQNDRSLLRVIWSQTPVHSSYITLGEFRWPTTIIVIVVVRKENSYFTYIDTGSVTNPSPTEITYRSITLTIKINRLVIREISQSDSERRENSYKWSLTLSINIKWQLVWWICLCLIWINPSLCHPLIPGLYISPLFPSLKRFPFCFFYPFSSLLTFVSSYVSLPDVVM